MRAALSLAASALILVATSLPVRAQASASQPAAAPVSAPAPAAKAPAPKKPVAKAAPKRAAVAKAAHKAAPKTKAAKKGPQIKVEDVGGNIKRVTYPNGKVEYTNNPPQL